MQTKLNTSQLNYDVKTPENSFTSASETQAGIVERATDAEVVAGTDTVRYISPAHTKLGIFNTYGMIASNNLQVSADNEVFDNTTIGSGTTYKKHKEIKLGDFGGGGSVKVSFDLKLGTSGGDTIGWGRIYVNGVAIGTERQNTTASYQTFTENININGNDLVQLYLKETTGTGMKIVYARNFRISYDKTSRNFTPTINLN